MYAKQYWRGWRDAVRDSQEEEYRELQEKLIVENVVYTKEGYVVRQEELEEESDLFLEEDVAEGVI